MTPYRVNLSEMPIGAPNIPLIGLASKFKQARIGARGR